MMKQMYSLCQQENYHGILNPFSGRIQWRANLFTAGGRGFKRRLIKSLECRHFVSKGMALPQFDLPAQGLEEPELEREAARILGVLWPSNVTQVHLVRSVISERTAQPSCARPVLGVPRAR